MRQKGWISDLELGMLLEKRTREGLQALCLEEVRAQLLVLKGQVPHDCWCWWVQVAEVV